MMRSKILTILTILLAVFSCKQIYTPPVLQTNPNLLVVDGFINSGAGASTTFILSRTQKIGDSLGAYTPERQAQVSILGSAGDVYALNERGNGVYSIPSLSLNHTERYQLKIITHNGSQYLSDTVSIRTSPPIDSLTWQQNDSSGNVIVSVNTHDPTNNSHYYRWFFTETWEYNAPLKSELGLDSNGNIYYAIDTFTQQYLIYTCWRSDSSTDIVLGNTTALGQDRVNQQPIATIPRGNQKLTVRYSILASQYVLSPQAYQYWLILQKNSQNLGSLFDPQPSQLSGNYHCLTNPNEPVIGFLSTSSITQQRLFISNSQINNWNTLDPGCGTRVIDQSPLGWQVWDYPDPNYAPYYFSGPTIIIAKKTCTDCRAQGGTTTKPSFW
jgi:hypothetical protein